MVGIIGIARIMTVVPTGALTDRLKYQIDEYRQLWLIQMEEATKRRKVSHLKSFFKRQCIFNVIQITAKVVQLHLNHLAEIGYGHSTLRSHKAAISFFCQYLVQSNEIEDNPCDHVRNPLRPERKMPHFLNDEQVEQILQLAAKIPVAGHWTLYEPILLALKTGLTVNEIQLIQWKFFDFGCKLISTYRPKTRKSRTIPMHSKVIEVFEPRRSSGYVFARPDNGVFYSIPTWQRWINAIQDAVPDVKGWHDFRRTFAVKMGKAGVPPVEIMHILGHANLETTMRYMNYAPSNYNENIENA